MEGHKTNATDHGSANEQPAIQFYWLSTVDASYHSRQLGPIGF